MAGLQKIKNKVKRNVFYVAGLALGLVVSLFSSQDKSETIPTFSTNLAEADVLSGPGPGPTGGGGGPTGPSPSY